MSESKAVRIDITTSILIAMSMVLFLYLSTFFNDVPDIAFKSLVGAVILIGGLAATAIFVGVKLDPGFFTGWQHSILYVGLAVASIIFSSQVVKVIPIGAIEQIPSEIALAFTLQMAIAEEVFFRGFVASFFQKLGGTFMGLLGSTGAWLAYHIFVYQTSTEALAFVAIIGVGFGLAFLLSGKHLWITTMVHVFHNLAVGW